MWHNPFSQRNKTIKRAMGVEVGGDHKEGKQNLEKQGFIIKGEGSS